MNILDKFFHYIDLKSEIEDLDFIHNEIEKGIVFKGTNLWILFFAIIVASVGLNVNSTAVIIGAMLISPLMGPINGIGYSLATYNFDLFRKSVKNFSFAVFTGLAASTFYFVLSPVSTAHSELLARTSPTIYDVMIAFFGGLAGIVAISSRLKGNVIPGVAIATALMPPLCTAGFGLATGQFPYFFGALYLFTINTVFIALSSVIVSQFLKFPIRSNIGASQKKRINQYISVVIVITLLPSIYFGFLLVQKESFSENATRFTKNVTMIEGSYLLKNEIDAEKRVISLVYGGNEISDENKALIEQRLEQFHLKNAKLNISQGFSFSDVGSDDDLHNAQISSLTTSMQEKQKMLDSLIARPFIGQQILSEINPLFPQIVGCSFADTYSFSFDDEKGDKTALIVFWVNKARPGIKERNNIESWIKARLEINNVVIFYELKE
jgi:uncharacterized hydrophobic protein (TIGR00271 family)